MEHYAGIDMSLELSSVCVVAFDFVTPPEKLLARNQQCPHLTGQATLERIAGRCYRRGRP
jgi:hypothetical protein